MILEEPIFNQLVGKKAFVDTLFIGLNGQVNAMSLSKHRIITPRTAEMYGCRAEGKCRISGNPWVLRYSRISCFRQVPLMQVQLRSEVEPITLEHVRAVAEQVCKGGFEASVSRLEFTFDLRGVRPEDLIAGVFTCPRSPAKKVEYRTTRYVGRPSSDWQVRMYPKPRCAPTVCRVEFVFRRPFLRRAGIGKPEDIGALRRLDLGKILTIRNLNMGALEAKIGPITPKWIRDHVLNWRGDLQDEERWLRRVVKLETGSLFPLAKVWRQILRMQRRFEW